MQFPMDPSNFFYFNELFNFFKVNHSQTFKILISYKGNFFIF